ncbi:hypothetical protein DPMN_149107 [Dreissena polymorpha]|uniref:Uncharacterized protein n=1 Tax=Dreissena polymorpha TaxID=45954 RepID=A0A9D4FDS2_DREPO|nr:hypothetical protein DPMN_149107 [Dreissena polymorpha]
MLNRAVLQGQCQPCGIDISRLCKPAMEPPQTHSVMLDFQSFGFHPSPSPPLTIGIARGVARNWHMPGCLKG